MNSSRFAAAVLIVLLLDKYRSKLITSEFIAASINVNALGVGREIEVWKETGFIEAKKGKVGGLGIIKDAVIIWMRDLYTLVNQENKLLLLHQSYWSW